MATEKNNSWSPELAAYVAWAEYPHLMSAMSALSEEVQKEHLVAAEVAGRQAAQEYLTHIALDFSGYMQDGGLNMATLERRDSPYDGVLVSRDDLLNFAREHPENDAHLTENKAQRQGGNVWGALVRLDYHLRPKKDSTAETNSPIPLIDMTMSTGPSSMRPDSFPLGTLVELLDEYDKKQKQYPKKKPSEILCRTFGEGAVDFLRRFVEYKIAQLDVAD